MEINKNQELQSTDIFVRIVEKIDNLPIPDYKKQAIKSAYADYFKFLNSDKKTGIFLLPLGFGKTVSSELLSHYKISTKDIAHSIFFTYKYEEGVYDLDEKYNFLFKPSERLVCMKFEGKSRTCTHKNDIINQRGDTIQKLIDNGFPITSWCEKSIKDKNDEEYKCKDTCDFYNNCNLFMNGQIDIIFTVSHQADKFFSFGLNRLERGDELDEFKNKHCILVFDEDFKDGIKIYKIYNSKRIDKQLNVLHKIYNKRENRNKKIQKKIDKCLGINGINVDLYRNRLKSIDNNKKYMQFSKDLISFFELLKTFLKKDEDELDNTDIMKLKEETDNLKYWMIDYGNYPEKIIRTILTMIKREEIECFELLLGTLFTYLNNYTFEEEIRPEDELLDWIKECFMLKISKKKYKKGIKKKNNNDNHLDKYISILFYNRAAMDYLKNHENIYKIIVNNATGDETEIKYLLNDPTAEVYENNFELFKNVDFFQICYPVRNNTKDKRKYAYYVKETLKSEKSRERLFEVIRIFTNRYRNSKWLVGCRDIHDKYLENSNLNFHTLINILGTRLKSEGKLTPHNYPLKVTEKYKDYNGCFLFIPTYPPRIFEREGILCGIPRNEIEEYTKKRKQGEMQQFLGRITREGEKNIVVYLTGHPTGLEELGIKIKKFYSQKELRKYFMEDPDRKIIEEYCKKWKYITVKAYMREFKCGKDKARNILNNKDYLIKKKVWIKKIKRWVFGYFYTPKLQITK